MASSCTSKWINWFILFSLLLGGYRTLAQNGQGEYNTSAGKEYSNFDTTQAITTIIPKARKYRSPDLLQLQLSGNIKKAEVTVYDYCSMPATNDDKTRVWGTRQEHSFNIKADRISAAKSTTYSILNRPIPPDEVSYKLADYKKDQLKISEVTGEEALVINFLKYSLFLDPEGNLKKEDGYFRFYYNDKGDCIRMVHQDRQFRYFYKYDAQNNWTQRLMWDSDEGIVQKIDRKILYE